MNTYAKIACAVAVGIACAGITFADESDIHRDLLYSAIERGTYDENRDLLYVMGQPPIATEADTHRDLLYGAIEAGTYDIDRDLLYKAGLTVKSKRLTSNASPGTSDYYIHRDLLYGAIDAGTANADRDLLYPGK